MNFDGLDIQASQFQAETMLCLSTFFEYCEITAKVLVTIVAAVAHNHIIPQLFLHRSGQCPAPAVRHIVRL